VAKGHCNGRVYVHLIGAQQQHTSSKEKMDHEQQQGMSRIHVSAVAPAGLKVASTGQGPAGAGGPLGWAAVCAAVPRPAAAAARDCHCQQQCRPDWFPMPE